MCMSGSLLRRHSAANYDGGRIIQECIVPASRWVINQNVGYDIDVREFLVTTKNEVVMRTIRHDIKSFLDLRFKNRAFGRDLALTAWEFFTSHDIGSFDFRLRAIREFVATKVKYHRSKTVTAKYRGKKVEKRDPWLFPDELLVSLEGDCEDISLLIASLMISSGISSYNVRVALGKVIEHHSDGENVHHDHVWVAYKAENGAWQIIEPLLCVKDFQKHKGGIKKLSGKRGSTLDSIEYHPWFTFNDEHLWSQLDEQTDIDFAKTLENLSRTWSGIDPGFAGLVHKSILDEALAPAIPGSVLSDLHDELCSRFTLGEHMWLPFIGSFDLPAIDDVDNFLFKDCYDPVDHFDSAQIVDSCKALNQRISEAIEVRGSNPSVFYEKMKKIFHATADFYAHTTYMHWQSLNPNFDPAHPEIFDFSKETDACRGADYTHAPLELSSNTFPICPGVYKGNVPSQIASLKDRLISGRYGIPDDPEGSDFIEKSLNGKLPWGKPYFPGSVRNTQALVKNHPEAALLPHHNRIAVDEAGKSNTLYPLAGDYNAQFEVRKLAAKKHIQRILTDKFGFARQDFANPIP